MAKEECENFSRCDGTKSVPKEEAPYEATIIGSAREMKKTHVVMHKARLNARGYKQIDEAHFDRKIHLR